MLPNKRTKRLVQDLVCPALPCPSCGRKPCTRITRVDMSHDIRLVRGTSADAVRGETTTITIFKKNIEQTVGVHLANTSDGRRVVISHIEPGSLCAAFRYLKPGAGLVDIMANDESYHHPSLQQAVVLIRSALGPLELTIMPLLDRYGFIISAEDLIRNPVTLDMARLENAQLKKWRRRVATARMWQEYAARKPVKLKVKIRQGIPEAVRGFVWKLLAAARAPADFRQDGVFSLLCAREEPHHAYAQIDKDVPRTMVEHIYYRAAGRTGQEALARVLKAYARFHPELGYTQGMSSFVAVLLLYLTEEDAFWTFATLMQHCGLMGLFCDGFPALFQQYDTWQSLLRKHLPRLDRHIKKEMLPFLGTDMGEYDQFVKEAMPQRHMLPSMYTTYWFQSMLIGGDSPVSPAVAPRMMDSILLDGHLGVIFRVGLALLESNERELLTMKGEELANALRTIPARCRDVDGLLRKAHEYNIRERLVSLADFAQAGHAED